MLIKGLPLDQFSNILPEKWEPTGEEADEMRLCIRDQVILFDNSILKLEHRSISPQTHEIKPLKSILKRTMDVFKIDIEDPNSINIFFINFQDKYVQNFILRLHNAFVYASRFKRENRQETNTCFINKKQLSKMAAPLLRTAEEKAANRVFERSKTGECFAFAFNSHIYIPLICRNKDYPRGRPYSPDPVKHKDPRTDLLRFKGKQLQNEYIVEMPPDYIEESPITFGDFKFFGQDFYDESDDYFIDFDY